MLSTTKTKTIENIHRLTKMIGRAETRTYATVVAIKPGVAVYTDGYGLVRYQNADIGVSTEGTVYIDRNVLPRPLSHYPAYEGAIKTTGEPTPIDPVRFIRLIQSIGTKPVKDIALTFNDKWSPYIADFTDRGGVAFNPWLIKKFLDLKTTPHEVNLYKGLIKISYGDVFDVTVVALRGDDDE